MKLMTALGTILPLNLSKEFMFSWGYLRINEAFIIVDREQF